MGLSRENAKKTTVVFGRWEIVVLVTIVGLAASTITLTINKYMTGGKNGLSGWEMRDNSMAGTVIGAFYNNLREEENVWICGSDEAVSHVKIALSRGDPVGRPGSRD
ncbi:MAG TPA: hypothetical protein ACFYED_05225 [Candidatus Tripitaka californicus]|uniref:hypothetical protein n=1 Tax=Candidatus Tripitaka californicus TaxID=3367616 RepID=UPI004028827E|nr:hypothetical protein [Planctomycetota bacterium]